MIYRNLVIYKKGLFNSGFENESNLIKILNEKSSISVDTETSSLNPLEAELIGISFSYDPNKAYYIP